MNELDKALQALYLEVSPSVADDINAKVKKVVKNLNQQVETLEESNEFYAENKNWYNHHNIDKKDAGIRESDLSDIDGKIGVYVGGRRARKAQKKLAELRNE